MNLSIEDKRDIISANILQIDLQLDTLDIVNQHDIDGPSVITQPDEGHISNQEIRHYMLNMDKSWQKIKSAANRSTPIETKITKGWIVLSFQANSYIFFKK